MNTTSSVDTYSKAQICIRTFIIGIYHTSCMKQPLTQEPTTISVETITNALPSGRRVVFILV
jgi:hypothetical protein